MLEQRRPHRRPLRWGRHIPEAERSPLAFFTRMAHSGPKVVRCDFAYYDYYLVNDPELLRHVLVTNAENYVKSPHYRGLKKLLGEGLLTSEGERWKHARQLAQPVFNHRHIDGLTGPMITRTRARLDRWAPLAKEGATFDLHKEAMSLTLEIVGDALFGSDLGDETSVVSDALDVALAAADAEVRSLVRLPSWMPTPHNLRFRRSRATLDAVVHRVLTARRLRGGESKDLLSILMTAYAQESAEGVDTKLRDEMLTLLVAGHETTANALVWTLFLLTENPGVREALEAEVDRAPEEVRTMAEAAQCFDLTKRVLEESLRLYPPAWSFSRSPISPDVIGDQAVDARDVVGICPYAIQRDPRYWEAPERFDPDRFLPERSKGRPRYVYLPFGAGPRVCIGAGFAMLEAQLLLAAIIRRYRVHASPARRVRPETVTTLRPADGFFVTLEPRN